jgi:coatomer protein complex subunit gamma
VYSLATLESKLLAYVNNPEAQTEAFDIQTVPKVSREQARQEAARESFFLTKFSPI